MSEVKEIKNVNGIVGYLHDIEMSPESILVFQLPRATNMLSQSYIDGAMASIKAAIPPGRTAMVIGADVNIYEISGETALSLKLKGLLAQYV